MTSKALVVFSGGQDSTTCLGWALAKYDEVSCITFDYGQRHVAEIEAAARVIKHFENYYEGRRHIHHEIVHVPDILRSASPLTDKAGTLETYTDHDTMAAVIGDRVEKTFVSMRNTLFLTIAANRAVAAGIPVLVTGVCQEDNANYPDCTELFIQSLETTFDISLGEPNPVNDEPALRILTPLMYLTKAETVRLALDTAGTYAALSFSHTAYDGRYPPTGKDHASVLRAHGFEQADRPDPLVLRAVHEGRMPLPLTHNYRPALSGIFTEQLKGFWA